MTAERAEVEGNLSHVVSLSIDGTKGKPKFQRSLTFTENEENKIQVSDEIMTATEEEVFTSTLDLDKKEQCRVSLNNDTKGDDDDLADDGATESTDEPIADEEDEPTKGDDTEEEIIDNGDDSSDESSDDLPGQNVGQNPGSSKAE